MESMTPAGVEQPRSGALKETCGSMTGAVLAVVGAAPT